MPGLLPSEPLRNVTIAWRRTLRLDPLLSRIPTPHLGPLAEAFNLELGGEDSKPLADVCQDLVREELAPAEVIRIATVLAETFADEIGTNSGATTKSLVSTLGHVCGLMSTVLVEDVNEFARRDYLTGLENRLAWEEMLEALRSDATAFAIAILDLNGFKEINDTRGHEEGDKVLQQFAAQLRDVIPEGARAFRQGGDEFSVIAPDMSPDELSEALHHFLTAEGAQPFSFGIASSAEEEGSTFALKKLADKRMYEMKASDRASGEESLGGSPENASDNIGGSSGTDGATNLD